MQIKSSLKQLWTESRANPGFTSLYIGGVAFAVAFTMIYAIIYYVHLAPIYPEYNRPTTYFINNISISNDNMQSMGSLGVPFYREFVSSSENIEAAGITYDATAFIQPPDNSGDITVVDRFIDPGFFKVYPYEFVAGRPFNEAETEAAMNIAIIDSTLARRLFGSEENAINKEVSLNFKPHRVIGVVKDGNPVAYMSYANVFVPYSTSFGPYTTPQDHTHDISKMNFLGAFLIPIKFRDAAQAERFREELNDKIRRINAADTTGWVLNIRNSPVSHTMRVLSHDNWEEGQSAADFIRPLLLILVVLLIIPAINISGMISGQMDRRIAEIGVRRSFGATRRMLTGQVMFENLVLTLVGGFLGLLVAWILIICGSDMLLKLIIPAWQAMDAPVHISAEIVFAPLIFFAIILICLILNLLSAYIPVCLSLRHPIVSSINSKR